MRRMEASSRAESSLLISGRWVLPVATPPLANGAVLVAGERIAAVGGLEKVAQAAGPQTQRLHFSDGVILPGLVNVHTHLELTALRGLLEETDFFRWIRKLVDLKAQRLDARFYELSAMWGALEAVRGGVTMVADACDSGATVQALDKIGLRGIVYQEVFGPDERQREESLLGLRRALDRHRSQASQRVTIGVSPHSPYTVSAPLLRSVAELALAERLPLSIHAAESSAERDLLTRGEGSFAELFAARGIAWKAPRTSSLRYLEEQGVLDARPLLVHCVDLSADDIAAVHRSGASIAHCPKSNAKLCHGVAPLLEILAAQIRTGLGTDGSVSSNNCDLLEEARAAVFLQRARSGLARAASGSLDARQALRIATLGGAEALGFESELGSLEAGKRASLVVLDLRAPRHQPIHDAEAAVIFGAGAADVALTVVDGRILYDGRTVAGIDESELRRELDSACSALRARAPADG